MQKTKNTELYKFIRKHQKKIKQKQKQWFEQTNPFCMECEKSRWKGHECEECQSKN